MGWPKGREFYGYGVIVVVVEIKEPPGSVGKPHTGQRVTDN
ncbi:hypothetical protein [Wolbachia pipientis]|nr:hypothetical protein [Wolbachia pipientis]